MKLLQTAMCLMLALAAGCCGSTFDWKSYSGPPTDDAMLAGLEAKITTRVNPVNLSTGEFIAASKGKQPGKLAIVARPDVVTLNGPWVDYPQGLPANSPSPAAVTAGASAMEIRAYVPPATNPTSNPPVVVNQKPPETSVITLTGSMPQVKGETYVAGSEGSTIAIGQFVEVLGPEHWVIRTIIVPIDSHPLTPLSVTPDGGLPVFVGPASFAVETHEAWMEHGVRRAGKSCVEIGLRLPGWDFVFPPNGKLTSNAAAARWIADRSRDQKAAKNLP